MADIQRINTENPADEIKTGFEKSNGNFDNLNTELVDQNARIDNIIAQSGTSDTEVVDARTNARGKVFELLKDRIDSIDMDLKQRAVSIEWFGAVGDGTDNTTAIQNALDFDSYIDVLVPAGKTFNAGALTINNPGVNLFIDRSTLILDDISLIGDNSGITGNQGAINGKLKVAQVSAEVPSGSTELTFYSHDFVVGDAISSSYGLGGDGSNPIQVTAVNGNTVTVAVATYNTIPANAYVGTFIFKSTITMTEPSNFITGTLDITNSQGYAVLFDGGEYDIDGLNVYNNGLDLFSVKNYAKVNFKNTTFGFIYDAAKQAVSVKNTGTIYCIDCHFERRSYDVEFYLYNAHNGTSIKAKNCTFVGTQTNEHPAPYNENACGVVNLGTDAGATIENIEFIDCEFHDYDQGIVTQAQSQTANDCTVSKALMQDCKVYRSLFGKTQHATIDFRIINTTFDGDGILSDIQSWIQPNADSNFHFENIYMQNDASTKILDNCRFLNCQFKNVTSLLFPQTASGTRNTFIESQVKKYPYSENNHFLRLFDSKIKHPDLTMNDNLNNIFFAGPNEGGFCDFSLLDGTLSGYLFLNNYFTTYVLEIRKTDQHPHLLYGDDWYFPMYSKIETMTEIDPASRFKYVSKSVRATLSADAAQGTTSVTLTSTTNVVVNDYINIALDNSTVHSCQITVISGNDITLSAGLPAIAGSGNNVCVYLY